MIPKTLNAVWFGPWKPEVGDYFPSWHTHARGFNWNVHTRPADSAFCRQAMKAKAFVSAADYHRLWMLHEYGGVYLDVDVELIRPIDHLLDHRLFVVLETEGYLCNAVMGATPGHPAIKAMLDDLDARGFDPKATPIEYGPRLVSRHLLGRDDVTVLPTHSFFPYPWDGAFTPGCVRPDTLGVHWWAAHWKPDEQKRKEGLPQQALRHFDPSLAASSRPEPVRPRRSSWGLSALRRRR